MKQERQELVQSIMEKMICVVKSMHANHGIPFGELKLSRPQVMVLFFIAKKKEGVLAKELAAFLNVTSGAITQFIDVLVQKKLLVRTADIHDRRTIRIQLTPFAQEKFAVFKKSYYSSVSPAFNNLNEAEMKQFIVFLEKIKIVSECKIKPS